MDAPIARFFDTIEHARLIKLVEHRVVDRRVIRLFWKLLCMDVLEQGQTNCVELVMAQDRIVSALLTRTCRRCGFDL